jgi:pilus assembly protein FimV
MRAAIPPAADFQAAGLNYHPSLRDVQLSLQRRPDGRPYLSVTSSQPVQEASVDLMLEASWPSGRIVRDYRLPLAGTATASAPAAPAAPATQLPGRMAAGTVTPAGAPAPAPLPAPMPATGPAPAAAPAAAAAPVTAPPTPAPAPVAAASAPAPAPVAAAPVPAPAAAAAPAAVAAAPAAPAPLAAAPEPAPAPPQVAAAPAVPPPGVTPPVIAPAAPAREVRVRAGDTAARIAMANKPAEASLDQMLVAMLRANPNAFIDGNVNRLKAGALLRMPGAEQAQAVPPAEASETVALHSRNFDEFRRKLAMQLQPVEPPSRMASGKLETSVTEHKPAPASPHRLKLASPAIGSRKTEERIAAELGEQEQRAARIASELKALAAQQQAAARAASTASAAAGASAPRGTASR